MMIIMIGILTLLQLTPQKALCLTGVRRLTVRNVVVRPVPYLDDDGDLDDYDYLNDDDDYLNDDDDYLNDDDDDAQGDGEDNVDAGTFDKDHYNEDNDDRRQRHILTQCNDDDNDDEAGILIIS